MTRTPIKSKNRIRLKFVWPLTAIVVAALLTAAILLTPVDRPLLPQATKVAHRRIRTTVLDS